MNAPTDGVASPLCGDCSQCRCAARMACATYDELTALARRRVRRHQTWPPADPVALVHEAFLRLSAQNRCWVTSAYFVAAAARVIKFILVERLRSGTALKRGGRFRARRLDVNLVVLVEQRDDRLDLRQALEHFARAYPNKARVVQLRFFAGLSVEDTAARLGLSPGGVRRHWYEARAWLADYLGALPSGPEARPQAEGVPPAAARA